MIVLKPLSCKQIHTSCIVNNDDYNDAAVRVAIKIKSDVCVDVYPMRFLDLEKKQVIKVHVTVNLAVRKPKHSR